MDLEQIVRFLSLYNCEQRISIIHAVENQFISKFIDLILEQPDSPARLCALAVLIEPIELYVRDFHDLLLSDRTELNNRERTKKLLEILLGLSNNDARAFKNVYKTLFEKSVENDIESIEGDKSIIGKLLIELLAGKRCEAPAHSLSTAKVIAGQLHEASEGRSDIDYDSLIQVFAHDTFPQLSAIFDVYEDKYGRSIKEAIKLQFKNRVETDCFQDMVEYIRSPSTYYAAVLRQALDQQKIDYRTFRRIIIGHQNKDLCEIKLEYSKIYDETLEDMIKNHIESSQIRIIFLTMINKAKDSIEADYERLHFNNKNKDELVGNAKNLLNTSDLQPKKNLPHEKFQKFAKILKLRRTN